MLPTKTQMVCRSVFRLNIERLIFMFMQFIFLNAKKDQTAFFYLIHSISPIAKKCEIAKILLVSKCPIDAQDNTKTTCLHEAIKFSQKGFIKYV